MHFLLLLLSTIIFSTRAFLSQYNLAPLPSQPLTTVLEHRRQNLFFDFPFDTLNESPHDLVSPYYFPVHLNGLPLAFHAQRTQTKRQASLGFLFSQGFACTNEMYEDHLIPAFHSMLEQVSTEHPFHKKNQTSEPQPISAETARLSKIVVPIGIGNMSYLLHFHTNDTTSYNQMVVSFLDSIGIHANEDKKLNLIQQIVSQMKVRVKNRKKSWSNFFPMIDIEEGKEDDDVEEEQEELEELEEQEEEEAEVEEEDAEGDQMEWNWGVLWSSNDNDNNDHDTIVYSFQKENEEMISSHSSSLYDYNPNNIWIINLWRSPVRRLHMHNECSREGILNVVKVFSGVDGLSLSEFVISNVLGEKAVLSTGEIGAFLSHLTLWWSIVRTSKPFAIIIEDDATLTNNFYSKLYYYIKKLTNVSYKNHGIGNNEGWDILFLERCGEMRNKGPDKDCRKPVYNGMKRRMSGKDGIDGYNDNNDYHRAGDRRHVPSLMHIDGTGCIPSGVRGYVLSQSGAKKLTSSALPLRQAIDVHIAEMIYRGQLNAYCTLPSIVRMHSGGIKSSDTASTPVYHTKINNEVVYTARNGNFPKCTDILCVLQYRVTNEEEDDDDKRDGEAKNEKVKMDD